LQTVHYLDGHSIELIERPTVEQITG